MANQQWFLRNIRPEPGNMSKGYLFLIPEAKEFDIDEDEWKDYKVIYNITGEKDADGKPVVEYDIPSGNIELSMGLAASKVDMDYVLSVHLTPLLEVYGPDAKAKADAEAKKARSAEQAGE